MIEVSRQDEALVIRITEQQLQMYAIPQFRAMVAEALAGKPKIVIFDLELVDHMDSSAMGAMFHFLKAVREYGGNLGVTHVSSKVMQVFKVTKAETQFPIFETPAAAIKEFKS
jgi:anti-anti-sigma factor